MKKFLYIFLLIFSLLMIVEDEYRGEDKESSFNSLESYVREECDFIQNGVKIEYITEKSLENEYERIDNILNQKKLTALKEKNGISCASKNINYSVNMYKYKDKLKVDIIVLNSNPELSDRNLIVLAEEIMGSNFLDKRYFSFIKGKIKSSDKDVFYDMKEKLDIDFEEFLDINNGYIAKANTKGKENINIGQINYDTGSYLIIGTPIIFITY